MTSPTPRPRRPAFPRPVKSWLLALHVVSGGAWLGASLCMLAISWANRDAAGHHAINEILLDLDLVAMIPAPLLSAATGLLLSWGTSWGFIRWYWVIAKQVLTYALMVAAPFTVHEWIARMAELSARSQTGPAYDAAHAAHLEGSAVMLAGIVAVVVVSVLKPWGRRGVSRHGARGREIARQPSRPTA